MVRAKLQYFPQWQGKRERVLEVMDKAAKGWALVDIDFRDHGKAEGKPRSEIYSKKESRKNGQNGKNSDRRPPLSAMSVVKVAMFSGNVRSASSSEVEL